MTLKPLSETRWESRVEALRPIVNELGNIYDALQEINNDSSRDMDTRSEAATLVKKIQNFNFICSVVLWFEILSKINVVSKFLQKKDTDIQTAIESLSQLRNFVKECRSEDFFNSIIEKSKSLADEIDACPVFDNPSNTVRTRKKKRMFTYESEDEPVIDKKEQFRVNFYYVLIDTVYVVLEERFELLQNHNNTFNFLSKLEYFSNSSNHDELLRSCKDLQIKLSTDDHNDIDGLELFEEIKTLYLFNVPVSKTSGDILKFIFEKDLNEIFPNLVIALRILLTMPVSVASAERSFSKLKLIKTYLRSTMGQDRLSNLAILSIEKDECEKIDFSTLIRSFAAAKARRSKFTF